MNARTRLEEAETSLADVLAAIAASPDGPQVGAFFDYDGTLIDGDSAGAYFTDRLKRGDMGARELVDTVQLMRKGDLSLSLIHI